MRTYSFCPLCREPLSTAFIDGRTRQHCQACSWVHYVNPLPVTVAYALNTKGELLVIRRAQEPGFNEWALPGGFLEIQENPADGCVREVLEETGVHGVANKLIGVYHIELEMYGSLLVIAYKVFVENDTITMNHEVSDARFFPLDALPQINIQLHQQIIREAQVL